MSTEIKCFYCGDAITKDHAVEELHAGDRTFLAHPGCVAEEFAIRDNNPTWNEAYGTVGLEHKAIQPRDTYLSDDNVCSGDMEGLLEQRREIACAILVGARINKQMLRMLATCRDAEIQLLGEIKDREVTPGEYHGERE